MSLGIYLFFDATRNETWLYGQKIKSSQAGFRGEIWLCHLRSPILVLETSVLFTRLGWRRQWSKHLNLSTDILPLFLVDRETPLLFRSSVLIFINCETLCVIEFYNRKRHCCYYLLLNWERVTSITSLKRLLNYRNQK